MYLSKLLSQKNNKWSPPRGEHLFRAFSQGSQIGYLVRIEALSFRSNNYGRNLWDVWYLAVVDGEVSNLKILPTQFKGLEGEFARYNGSSSYLVLSEVVETPLGEEARFHSLQLVGVTLEDACPQEKLVIANVAMTALREGFGPHGEIENSFALEVWAKEIIGR